MHSGAKLLTLLLFGLILSGCERLPFWSKDEGVIVYDLTYPHDQDFALLNIMPSEMKFYFKGSKMKYEVSSFAGILKSVVLADSDRETFDQVVSIFGEEMLLRVNAEELPSILNQMTPITAQLTSVSDSVSSCPCTVGLMAYAGEPDNKVTFCATEEIDIPNPNFFNQYHQIKGVLLDYEIEQMGMRVRVKAREIKRMELPENTFELQNIEKMNLATFAEIQARMKEMLSAGQQ